MESQGLFSSERRLNKRVRHQAAIMHETGNNGVFHMGQLVNYSSGGCCFETGVIHRPGDVVYIDFEKSPYAGGPAVTEGHRAEVVWCRKIKTRSASGRYGVGVKYDESFH